MSIHLIADSCCDLTPELQQTLNMDFAALKIRIDNSVYVDDGSINIPHLLDEMTSHKEAASSACPSPEDYAQYMRQYDECMVITLSSKLSGSYNAARIARDLVLEEFPNKKIHVFDSLSASAGELRIALFVKSLIDSGENFEAIVMKTTHRINKMRTMFVLEDLGNLVKNGRLNKVTGIVASILSLCPIMSDDGNGEVKMAAKARGMNNALFKMVDMIAESTAGSVKRSITLVLTYCNCPERAGMVKKNILERCQAIKDVIMAPTGGLSTVYANNGGIIVAY